MTLFRTLTTAATICAMAAPPASLATPMSLRAMQDHRRVLLVASPSERDPQAASQCGIFDHWKAQAADRDVSLVTITGAHVEGATDSAAALRKHYRLAPNAFQAILIGKDGHVALRSERPIDADALQGTIDAMPMRRAGGR